MDSLQVRTRLVDALRLDLIGPSPSDSPELQREAISELPVQFYLGGFLMPRDVDAVPDVGEGQGDSGDNSADEDSNDGAGRDDRPAAKPAKLQSSMGLSVLVPGAAKAIELEVSWGEYQEVNSPAEFTVGPRNREVKKLFARHWRRTPRTTRVALDITQERGTFALPGSELPSVGGAVMVEYLVRPSATPTFNPGLPEGTRSVSVFLANYRTSGSPVALSMYQVEMRLNCPDGFVARPDLRGPARQGDVHVDADDRVGDLHYRDAQEFVVGHAVSGRAHLADGACRSVSSVWLPTAEVEKVIPTEMPNVELGMEALAACASGAELAAKLQPLVEAYKGWIGLQKAVVASLDTEDRRKTADSLVGDANYAAQRIQAGVDLLKSNDKAWLAFKIANEAMAMANRHRTAVGKGVPMKPNHPDVRTPSWRPFQLAFVLQSLRGIVEPTHEERKIVDLLFFPTGGGKTEAYLGLAAFAIVHRRLANPAEPTYAGVSVLMRYTLRLLTIDQLGRAAGLVCALEILRKRPGTNGKLGALPFEIGLWVGSSATANRLGGPGDTAEGTALSELNAYRRNPSGADSPVPLDKCPWCGSKLGPESFQLLPARSPRNLVVCCANPECSFSDVSSQPLPIIAVDEPLYRRLPCFVISTLDKFAALPWFGQVGALFGKVDRHNNGEFFGPPASETGSPLPDGLLPPDLIIQDELHLISGPLGTVAGLYESAIERLCWRKVGDVDVLPKIVASTATVRRAERQIRALFGRPQSCVFPPPGPNRRDSFFAKTVPATEVPARLYLGVSVQGRNQKVMLMRVSNALMAAAQRIYEETPLAVDVRGLPADKAEAKREEAGLKHPADPYMTLLSYYNSLRELGGSRRIYEDEVNDRLRQYGERERLEPRLGLFANRLNREPMELTSRVTTSVVADTKRRLDKPHNSKESLDVALATNMISVGLDIQRLGLLLVAGQPKTSAEYIQATSRVGRDDRRPGLIVTLLNAHRPRDRSHYERFGSFHETFYRSVEASSVTPFSPRALDRALAAVIVGLSRHAVPGLTKSDSAGRIIELQGRLEEFAVYLGERAAAHSPDLSVPEKARLAENVRQIAKSLISDWNAIARVVRDEEASRLLYGRETSGAQGQRLLLDFLSKDADEAEPRRKRFRAPRSMRDVERVVVVNPKRL